MPSVCFSRSSLTFRTAICVVGGMPALHLADRPSRRARTSFGVSVIAPCFTLALTSCAPIAGLEEHLPYLGFPDSLSVPCSDGTMTVKCESVRDTAPQDGHFVTARPSYRISGNEVIDSITGLVWYRLPGEPQSHELATKYCEVLPGDYRLPTRIELVSILDFRANSPIRIDTDAFPDVQASAYWTSTRYATDPDRYWSVDFCVSCMSEYLIRSDHTSTHVGALCVKSDGDSFKTGPFEIAGEEDRFVRDTRTGLMWMKKLLEPADSWRSAIDACRKAPDGAYGDFRLPNAKELATIVDDKQADGGAPAVHQLFEIEYDRQIWSSTPTSIEGRFFELNVTGGSLGHFPGSLGYIFPLCVRGPD